jgi:hypothetical protein
MSSVHPPAPSRARSRRLRNRPLLGAQVMLTGIQPQIAQTLVHLGVDLTGIQTRSSLQGGLRRPLPISVTEAHPTRR